MTRAFKFRLRCVLGCATGCFWFRAPDSVGLRDITAAMQTKQMDEMRKKWKARSLPRGM